MSHYGLKISPYINAKLYRAEKYRQQGEVRQEFACLEDAHVLGQESTYWHTKVHFEMLTWGFRNGSTREVFGQLFRLIGAITKTAIGLLPDGNTGGSNVSPFKPMPVREDLQAMMQQARRES